MRVVGRSFVFGLAGFLLLGCTKPPEIPNLGTPQPSPIDRLVFDSSLTAKDYREIFQAINRNGKLNALRPYVESPSDETLEAIGGMISRKVYENSFSRESFLSVLENRVHQKSFSKILEKINHWKKSRHFKAERNLLFQLAKEEKLKELLTWDSGFLEPAWWELVKQVRNAKNSYADSKLWKKEEPATAKEMLADVEKFLNSPSKDSLVKLFVRLREDDFGGVLFRTLKEMTFSRSNGQIANPSQLAVGATLPKSLVFEGVGYGLAALLEDPSGVNRLEKLLEFIDLMNRPSDGLFLAIADKFVAEPDYGNEIAKLFNSTASGVLFGFLKEVLSQKKLFDEEGRYYDKAFWQKVAERNEKNEPSQEFIELFIAIRTALERVAGPVKSAENDDDATLQNLPIYTTAFVLTKWLENVVRENIDTENWKQAPEVSFHQTIWKLPVSAKELAFDLTGGVDPKATDNAELAQIGLEDFATEIKALAEKGKVGKFYYRFNEVKALNFEEAVRRAIEVSGEVRPISDPGAFIRAIIFPITRKEKASFFSVRQLESPNLFQSLNALLMQLSFERWKSLKQTIFGDLKLGQLQDPNFDTRRLILDFYASEPLRSRVERLLDLFPLIEDFDRSLQSLPSPFEAYFTLVKNTSVQQLGAVSEMARFVSEAKLFSGRAEAPHYPSLFKTLKQGSPVASTLYAFSQISPRSGQDFLLPFWRLLGENGEGLEAHFSMIKKVIREEPEGSEAFLERLFQQSETVFEILDGVSSIERKCLLDLIRDDEFVTFIEFLQSKSSRASLLALVKEVKTLSQNGYLLEAFQLLKQIRNERMQRVGEVMTLWQESSQLLAFLESLETLLD